MSKMRMLAKAKEYIQVKRLSTELSLISRLNLLNAISQKNRQKSQEQEEPPTSSQGSKSNRRHQIEKRSSYSEESPSADTTIINRAPMNKAEEGARRNNKKPLVRKDTQDQVRRSRNF
jgi:hypothetical protein